MCRDVGSCDVLLRCVALRRAASCRDCTYGSCGVAIVTEHTATGSGDRINAEAPGRMPLAIRPQDSSSATSGSRRATALERMGPVGCP